MKFVHRIAIKHAKIPFTINMKYLLRGILCNPWTTYAYDFKSWKQLPTKGIFLHTFLIVRNIYKKDSSLTNKYLTKTTGDDVLEAETGKCRTIVGTKSYCDEQAKNSKHLSLFSTIAFLLSRNCLKFNGKFYAFDVFTLC